MDTLKQFTNLYQLSKTLRFELKPVGKTLDSIYKNGLLEQDRHRSESYKLVKKIIDDYHKAFIEKALSDFKLKLESENKYDSLEEYYFYYTLGAKNENRAEGLKKVQANLRKQIAEQLTKGDTYKRIDKKELIKEDLPSFVKTIEERDLVSEFKDFTTYFTGFHENRKNMYSAEEKSTAISYRLINENLPKFVDNIKIFEKVVNTALSEKLTKLYEEFNECLNVNSIAEIFALDNYSMVLTQKQIEVYNSVIGGKPLENGDKIQGLNEYINHYNQQQKDKNARLPKLKPLYKQILSDRDALSWLPEEFTNGDDIKVLKAIEKGYRDLVEVIFENTNKNQRSIKDLLCNLNDYDLDKIYVRNDLQLTEISQGMFGNWGVIQKAIEADFERNNQRKTKESEEKYEDRKHKFIKSFDSFSIGYINSCLLALGEPYNKKVEDYFKGLGAVNTEALQKENLFERILITYSEVKDLLNTQYPDSKNLSQDHVAVEKIKNLLDAIKELQWFVKPLLGKGDESEKDERFYSDFSALYDKLNTITPLYNKVRNYMTRKPYLTDKIKLNFENSSLLSGWSQDYETKAGLIFVKDGLYYLAINNKKLSEIEKETLKLSKDGNIAKRVILDFQKPDNKNVPRLFIRSKGAGFAPAVEKYNLPVHDIINIYDSGKFKTEYRKKNPNEYLESLHLLIDYFKEGFLKHESYKHYDFAWRNTIDYKDIAEFYHDVEVSCYQVKYENVNWETLNKFVEEGKLYLFQIYNKDFSQYSKGTPNMHTLYWKMIFDEINLQNVVYKLNGKAEIFFREKTINWNDEIMQKGHHAEKLKDKFSYPIIEDKRYSVDKFQFHVPITMNFKSLNSIPNKKELILGFNTKINNKFLEYIKYSEDVHIIGIDRGERHLLYLSMIDMYGKIIKQFSLNEIINEYKSINYHDLLDDREKKRDEARRSWQTIKSIKDLKEGYLSQVIHKITELVVEYNAIVVLEDLNSGFMRGRQKVEKQVYQKFEKMFIDKLNYLVDKKKDPNEKGGLLHALQLSGVYNTDSLRVFKQSGILFYVPAWNTSKMDPTTGFVNLFNTHYETIEKSKAFFSKFESIRYNENKDWFEFEVKNYSLFNPKADDTKQNWTICTYGNRIKTFRNPDKNSERDNEEINLTAEFKQFFKAYNIDIKGNLKESIISNNEKTFFYNDMKGENKNKPKGILQLFSMILQMRNSYTDTKSKELHLSPKEADYLISPVMNSKGEFYDSRTCGENLPQNADANGAYNIARKGLILIRRLKNGTIEEFEQSKNSKKGESSKWLPNKEWLQFAQSRDK